jgi:hypothetical protein
LIGARDPAAPLSSRAQLTEVSVLCRLVSAIAAVPENSLGRRRANKMSELSLTELDAQHTELLPEREALGVYGSFNHAHIYIHQSNIQTQFLTHGSHESATNVQVVNVGNTVTLETLVP